MSTQRTDLQLFIDDAAMTVDYCTAIGIGGIAGHQNFRGLGRRTALATTVGGDDIWEGAAVAVVYPDQSVGERMTFVSASANDTSAGSGVRTVELHYLDASGIYTVETITMNGVTPVHTVATNIRFVQFIHAASVGAIGVAAAGDIIVYRYGDAARIYGVIKAGGNASLNAQRMVPANKTYYMTNVRAEAVDNKPVSVRLRATCDYDGNLTPNVFIFSEVFELYNSSSELALVVPRMFPPLCIIKGTAISTTAGGTASLSYDGWIE